jgi:hypothetical protein
MEYIYYDVPGLGDVEVSIHAEERRIEENISPQQFLHVLRNPVQPDIPSDHHIILRERNGIRLVIFTNTDDGVMLVKTMYRIHARRRAS